MKNAAFHMVTALLAIGLMSGANLAQAQAGSLDTTFGTGGTAATSFADGVVGVGAFEQSNGDIVAVTQVNFVSPPVLPLNKIFSGIGKYCSTSGVLHTAGAKSPQINKRRME